MTPRIRLFAAIAALAAGITAVVIAGDLLANVLK